MLVRLTVENLALFSSATLNLEGGFCALTGETGAGKSLLVDALSFICGKRVGKEIIRSGTDSCEVSALFSPVGGEKQKALSELGISVEDDGVVFSRVLKSDGRSVCRIDGVQTTLSVLRRATSLFCDIHEQEDSTLLLDDKNHLFYLDAFSSSKIEEKKRTYQTEFETYTRLKEEFSAVLPDKEEDKARREFLTYQIRELESAKIKAGEVEALTQKKNRLSSQKKLTESVTRALSSLNGEGGAYDCVMRASDALSTSSDVVGEWKELSEKLENIAYELREIAACVKREEMEEDPSALLEQIDARLSLYKRLFSLYAPDETSLLALLEDKKAELERMDSAHVRARELHAQAKAARDVCLKLAEELSVLRKESACVLEREVQKHLQDLDMPAVRFAVHFEKTEKLTSSGLDNVSFYVGTNVGQEMSPLSKTASGGELSRILLAIRCVMGEVDGVDVLVFDEIDTGVSGKSAQKIGRAMRALAANGQVLAVTHSAQVSSCAHTHVKVEKHVENQTTVAKLTLLDERGREEELARILGGETVTQISLANAKQLLCEGKR